MLVLISVINVSILKLKGALSLNNHQLGNEMIITGNLPIRLSHIW
jgi:hypothetical protein